MGKSLLIILMMVASAGAQPSRGRTPAAGRTPTRTRLVAQYYELEKQLATAAQNQDQARLEQLLDDDFEQWGPEPPGDPISRDDWKAAYRPTSFGTRQMAVRAFSDTDIVSFVARQKGTFGDREMIGDCFVVDVWRHEGNSARLAARYIAKAPEIRTQPASPPGKH